MSGDSRCPVCGRPAGPPAPGASCGECGWLLHLPPRAGPVTADMRRDFDSRLRAARRGQAERDARALTAALREVIGDLRPGAASAVIDVGPNQVTTTTAYLDSAGSPRLRESAGVAWTGILRSLAGGERERRSQLADGIEGLGDDELASLLRDGTPPAGDDSVLVVCWPAGWRVLEAAARTLAARPRARLLRLSDANGVSVREELADLAAKAPLRHPYRLMTAAVSSQTGAVTLRPRELFAAGTEPGTEAILTLRRLPGDVSDTTLAIFSGTGDGSRDADYASRDPLALYSVSWPPGPAARLRAILDGPGRVRIAEPPGAVPHPGSWAQVRGQIPSQLATAAGPVDLVCAIDLAGSRDAVRQRVHLVQDLVRLLGAEYPDQRRLRVALVTCTDHVYERGMELISVTSACELGPADEALAWLSGTRSADISYPHCSPVEDLLDESYKRLAGSRQAGRVPLLLTVAGRHPHPASQLQDQRLPCPRALSWQVLMDQLTRRAGVRCAVVADALTGRSGRDVWRRLGPASQHALSAVTARQLAQNIGLLAAHDQRIPLPLTDEP